MSVPRMQESGDAGPTGKLRKVEATSKAHDVTAVDCPTTVGLGAVDKGHGEISWTYDGDCDSRQAYLVMAARTVGATTKGCVGWRSRLDFGGRERQSYVGQQLTQAESAQISQCLHPQAEDASLNGHA